MISKLAVALLATLVVIPAYAQQYSNPSLILQTISVPSDDFNKIHENLVIVPLEKEHSGSWQITIENHLLYANPKGNAI
ncbi:MAG: hypothetical protein EB166_09805, partial [Thaumarchaeota archaeon]|nr:hypothetical protein [Nitrososphaerota archaeon]